MEKNPNFVFGAFGAILAALAGPVSPVALRAESVDGPPVIQYERDRGNEKRRIRPKKAEIARKSGIFGDLMTIVAI